MINKDSVRAQVIDIRGINSTIPRSIVVDTNILYFVYYDPAFLSDSGGQAPRRYQLAEYPSWWRRALSGQVLLSTSIGCLSEFCQLVERTELEIRWRNVPEDPESARRDPDEGFTSKVAKDVRYLCIADLPSIRDGVATLLQAILKNVEVLPQPPKQTDREILASTFRVWERSGCDFTDAALVNLARGAGIPRILTDDADLITFEGITVYTANSSAIDAAKQSGKLTRGNR